MKTEWHTYHETEGVQTKSTSRSSVLHTFIYAMPITDILLGLLLTSFIPNILAYTVHCPVGFQRQTRARGYCGKTLNQNYACLFDTNAKRFKEYCNVEPDYAALGEYYVFSGRRRNVKCNVGYYQPFPLWSNESSGCIYAKTNCFEEGQIEYKNGSTVNDTTCRCDFSKGYSFYIIPKHRCFCMPAEEDCSCFINRCSKDHVLNADYECSSRFEMKTSTCPLITNLRSTNKDLNLYTNALTRGASRGGTSEIAFAVVAIIFLCGLLVVTLAFVWKGCSKYMRRNDGGVQECRKNVEGATQDGNETIQKNVKEMESVTSFHQQDEQSVDTNKIEKLENLKEENFNVRYIQANTTEETPSQEHNITTEKTTENSNIKNCDEKDKKDKDFVVAIDFGTTYSGYAYGIDSTQIDLNPDWSSGSGNLISKKTPTSVLLNQNGECISFGYVAENEYADIIMDKEDDQYLFFHRFKMILYEQKNISDDMVIKDIKGKPMPALLVFSAALAKLKESAEKCYENRSADHILWVVTVPAIWSDKAKEFMRKSAEKAGMKRDRLLIALESECASIYCQDLSQCGLRVSSYLVVDIGGGTVDITSHKTESGIIKEIGKPSGSNWGSTKIDDEFMGMIKKIVGEEVMTCLIAEHVHCYFDLLRHLEKLKCPKFGHAKISYLHFPMPFTLNSVCKEKLGKEFKEALEESECRENMFMKTGQLCIKKDYFENILMTVVSKIIGEIKTVLENLHDTNIETIIVVGGFSKSPVFQQNTDPRKLSLSPKSPEFKTVLDKDFEGIDVIVLENDAEVAVMKGAVLFGLRPKVINSRVTQYTYGRIIQPPFLDGNHDPERCIVIDGIKRCNNVFEVLMEKDKSVKFGEKVIKEYEALSNQHHTITIGVYVTKNDNVRYIDDDGCKPFCEIVVDIPENNKYKPCVSVCFEFGSTEFKVIANEKNSGKVYETAVSMS